MDEFYENDISRWEEMVRKDRESQHRIKADLPPVGTRVCRTCGTYSRAWAPGRNCLECSDCWKATTGLPELLSGCLRAYNARDKVREGPCVKCAKTHRMGPLPEDGICDNCLQDIIITAWEVMRHVNRVSAGIPHPVSKILGF